MIIFSKQFVTKRQVQLITMKPLFLIIDIFAISILLALSATKAVSGGNRVVREADPTCFNQLDERSCSYFASLGLCGTRRASMMKNCMKACKFCTEKPCKETKFGCCFDGKTRATGPHLQGCDGDCKDIYDRKICEAFKRRGDCLKPTRGHGIKRKCAITCGYCRPCADLDPYECQLTAKYGGCSTNTAIMAERCRKSCNFCGSNDPCFNHMCPKHSVCVVGINGRPVCHCDGNCHKGDFSTGLVCGRDGIQYKNLCELKKKNCGHPSVEPVTVKRYGTCQPSGEFPRTKNQICEDGKDDPPLCKEWVKTGFCTRRKKAMRTICPKSCNFCAVQTAKPACHYSKHGCCLDKKSPCLSTNYKGCPKYPACKDFSKIFCRRFVAVCGGHGHKSSMRHYCPKTCQLCG